MNHHPPQPATRDPSLRSTGTDQPRTSGRGPLLLALGLLLGAAAPAADRFVRLPDLPSTATSTWLTAWGDYDNDGDIDLAVANGAYVPSETIGLYRNRGDGTFELMTAAEAGSLASEAAGWGVVAWVDLNNDGFLDLFATAASGDTAHAPSCFLNQGDGSFRALAAGTLTTVKGTFWAAPPGDLNGDGYADLLLLNETASIPLQPHFNRGDGTFVRSREAPIGTETLKIYGWVSLVDYDGDGDLDVFAPTAETAGSPHRDRLYENDGLGNFISITNAPLLETGGTTFIGDWGDFDNDGDLDCILAKSGAPILLVNQAGAFSPVDLPLPPTPVGPIWIDYDNDGHLDLYLQRGQGEAATNSLLQNLGNGTFEPVTDLLTTENLMRQGAAWGDFDNDGFMDLVETDPNGGTRLYRNVGNGNHWLKLRLKGTASNAAGLGATIRVRATLGGQSQWQMQQVGSAHLQQQDLRPNFGLADATVADEVRIEWPSGNVQTLTNVAADQILTVTEWVRINPVRPVVTLNGTINLTNALTVPTRQWYFEGVALAGETNKVLSLTNAQPALAGRYTVVAQTTLGPQTHSVHLRVDTQFTKILEGEIVTEDGITDTGTWFDYDNDGRLDVYVPHDVDQADSLFRNAGDGTFTKILGNPAIDVAVSSLAAAAGDFDNDGDVDLFIPHSDSAPEDLLLNDGKGVFSRVADPTFKVAVGRSMDAAWADYDRDGDLDLLVVRGYGSEKQNLNDSLYRNNGNGSFTAMTAAEVGPLVSDQSRTFLCNWIDYNADGYPDAVVQHTDGRILLHHNNGDGTFTPVQPGSLGAQQSDWGISWADYDNDGFPDLFVGRGSTPGGPALHRNLGGLTFTNVISGSGIRLPRDYCLGAWGDYDNDGFLDLLLAGYDSSGFLYRNRGDGTFQSVEAGNLLTDGFKRNGVWVDYDNNGFLDLFVGCGDWVEARNQLFRNNGNGNHWLKVKTVGTVSNRDGIGAKVRVKATIGGRTFTQMREISGNSGYHGVPLLAHFGLGNATSAASVRVEWPSGIVQELGVVAADQALTIVEPVRWMLSARVAADGVHLECRGAPSATAYLQQSSDLRTWVFGANLTTDATGVASVTIPFGAVNTPRFYRLKVP